MKHDWDEQGGEDRRENAYKILLIVSLCISIISCTCFCTVFPLLYQILNLSDSQFGGTIEFCEYTAENVLLDTNELLGNRTASLMIFDYEFCLEICTSNGIRKLQM